MKARGFPRLAARRNDRWHGIIQDNGINFFRAILQAFDMLEQFFFAAASMTGPTSVESFAGSPTTQFAHRAFQHRDCFIRRVFGQTKNAQCRASLPRGTERAGDDIIDDLFRQSRTIDNQRILAAGFGDQRHNRAVFGGQRAVDRARRRARSGESDARDERMRDQRRADIGAAGDEMENITRNTGIINQLGDKARDFAAFAARAWRSRHCRKPKRGESVRGKSPAENSTG